MVNINWKIIGLRRLEDGLVIHAEWRATGEEITETKTYTSRAGGVCIFERGDSFIPFEELTEELVLQWVKEQLGSEEVLNLQQKIETQIDKQKNPQFITGVPW